MESTIVLIVLQCLQVASVFLGAAAGEEVPRLDASTLLPGDLLKSVTKPVVLTNLAEDWPATYLWNKDYLASVHGKQQVMVPKLPEELFENDAFSTAEGNSLYADHVRNAYVPFVRIPKQISLAEYIRHQFDDYVFDIGESVAQGLCVDAFGRPDLLPELLAADDLTQLTFGMGPANEGVMFHAHTAAWNALMFGEKEWFFYNPENFTGEAYERLSLLGATHLAEAFGSQAGDLAFAGATVDTPKPLRVRQRAGEVVFVPDGWWHATVSHTETACLGGQRHKDRLPQDYAEKLLSQWPASGLFLNFVAKERADPLLFEAVIKQEPVNLRFVMEYMSFLREQRQYTKVVKIAQNYQSAMEKACRQSYLGQAELGAVLAEIAGFLYFTVNEAVAAQAAFMELMQVSLYAKSLIDEALRLDPGCPAAQGLLAAITVRSAAADFSKLPPGFLNGLSNGGADFKKYLTG